ncbi:hypothetical protein KUCAC02_026909 [Chaenocephalus aceratus]|nr:hypothetical protein KUCAC02_026909 [Chaenocephalus aceratus]
MNMLSLWRYPPQPELRDSISDLPSPKYYQLHPYFIWKPEHAITDRVRNNGVLPRLYGCPNPQVVSSGAGRPRVILGTSGQYYILASRLTCKVCKKYWHADKPQWLEKLPQWLEKLPQWLEKLPQWLEKLPQWLEKLPQWLEKLPQWLEKLPQWLEKLPQWLEKLPRRFSNIRQIPEDTSKQLTEALNLQYESAHLAYLLCVQNVRDAEAGVYGQRTITGFLRQEDTPAPCGGYSDGDGWCGVSASSLYLVQVEELLALLLQGPLDRP